MAGREEQEEEGIDAARILLSLRNRKLLRWPDWVPWSSSSAAEEPVVEEKEEEMEPMVVWATTGLRRHRARTHVWSFVCPMPYGGSARSGASPSQEKSMDAGRSDTPPSSGSRPSTSGADLAPAPTEVKGAARRETLAALSPNTTLDYPSSGDDGTRSSPAKRKAPVALPGSVGVSTDDDKACRSPAKRPRVDLNVDEEPKKADEKKREEENYRDEKGYLLFDLNADITPWD